MRVYLKRFSSFLLIFTFVFSMLSFSLPVHAEAPDVIRSMPCSEPQLNDNTGYMLLLCQGSDGSYWVTMINWSYYLHIAENDSGFDNGHIYYPTSFVDVDIKPNVVTISPVMNTTYNYHTFNVSRFVSTGNAYIMRNDSLKKGQCNPYSFQMASGTVVGYQVFGNYGNVTCSVSPQTTFGVIWSDDYGAYERLLELQVVMNDILYVDNTIQFTLTDILDEVIGISLSVDELEDLVNQLEKTLHKDLLDIKGQLQDIIDILEGSGQDSLEKPPDDSVNDALNEEDELLNNDTSDAEEDIDITIDTGASESIWGIIQSFLDINSSVFGFYITILSLGIIILILNR